MKNVRRIAKWLMACMMTVFLAGVVSAAETTEKGEISSFNNYGENGVYEAIGEYEVAYGSVVADVTRKLPSTLTAKLTTGEEVEVPVTWVCVSDNLGGNTYVPKHSDVSAVYTFEAQLGDGYKIAGNLPEDYVMPFVTVSYTQDAQELNSQAPEMDTEINAAVDGKDSAQVADYFTGLQDSAGTMTLWMIIVVVLWWLFAGSKNNKEK